MSAQTREGFYLIDFIADSFDTHPKPLYDGDHLRQLMAQPGLEVDIRTIRTAQSADVVEKAKRRLPAVVWGGHFTCGKRRQTEVESSGLFGLDIDHIADAPDGARQYYQEHFGGREDELGVVFAHVSPSGTGLHVVCLCQPGLRTIAENQQWLAAKTRSDFDPVCKDMGRIFYLSTIQDVIYNDLEQ